MRIKYDPETDTLSIRLKEEPVADSEYIEGKGIVIDYNENDEIIGYEIMGWNRFQKSGKELILEMVS
jgi:uncharacterized protein YuzE